MPATTSPTSAPRSAPAAFAGGAIIGTIGGLIGLGGAVPVATANWGTGGKSARCVVRGKLGDAARVTRLVSGHRHPAHRDRHHGQPLTGWWSNAKPAAISRTA